MVNFLPNGAAIRARAPLRISFGGGGTELTPYVEEHGGVVLNATIGRYVYATLTAADAVTFTAIDVGAHETHPAAAAYPLSGEGIKLPLHRAVYNRIVREYHGGKPLPLSLRTYSDVPVGSGLGTSSTLTVAMVRCFDEALGLNLGEYELAALAHDIERADLGLSGGYQDHYAAAFGGLNFMEFRRDGEVIVNPLRLRPWVLAELEYSLILYFTGVSRESANIIDEQSRGLKQASVVASMHRIKELAYMMKDALLTGRIADFAASLHDSWLEKRTTAAAVSNTGIDTVYQQARAAGVLGGKISGAGGGGFMMLIADPARRQEVLDCLSAAGGEGDSCHFSRAGAYAWRVRNGG